MFSGKPNGSGVTGLLKAWSRGDEDALEQLAPLVEHELHNLARKYLRKERPGQSLQTTELVNEVYLRLIDTEQLSWQDRAHFFAVSARIMRHILTDIARSRSYLKRGGGALPVTWDETLAVSPEPDSNIVALDEALKELALVDPRKSQVVELRFLGVSVSRRPRRFSKSLSKRSCAIGSLRSHG